MRIAICDDDSAAQDSISGVIRKICAKRQTKIELKQYRNGEQLIYVCAEPTEMPDLIFLDIHMEGPDGMETARRLRASDCRAEIVFLTVDDSQWQAAFEVDAIYYAIKDDKHLTEKLEWVLDKAINRVNEKNTLYMTFACAGEIRNVPIDEIEYFEVQNHLITVHYSRGKSFEFYSTIDKLYNQLFDKGFVRVHRAFLVARDEIVKLSNGKALLRSGAEIPVGRSIYKELAQELKR